MLLPALTLPGEGGLEPQLHPLHGPLEEVAALVRGRALGQAVEGREEVGHLVRHGLGVEGRRLLLLEGDQGVGDLGPAGGPALDLGPDRLRHGLAHDAHVRDRLLDLGRELGVLPLERGAFASAAAPAARGLAEGLDDPLAELVGGEAVRTVGRLELAQHRQLQPLGVHEVALAELGAPVAGAPVAAVADPGAGEGSASHEVAAAGAVDEPGQRVRGLRRSLAPVLLPAGVEDLVRALEQLALDEGLVVVLEGDPVGGVVGLAAGTARRGVEADRLPVLDTDELGDADLVPHHVARVDGVAEDAADRRRQPALAARGREPVLVQLAGELGQTDLARGVAAEDPLHGLDLVRVAGDEVGAVAAERPVANVAGEALDLAVWVDHLLCVAVGDAAGGGHLAREKAGELTADRVDGEPTEELAPLVVLDDPHEGVHERVARGLRALEEAEPPAGLLDAPLQHEAVARVGGAGQAVAFPAHHRPLDLR